MVEKDTMNSMISDIPRDVAECVKTTILEENWEEKHKLLLEEFIRDCFDISIVSYGILALLGYYIRSLHTPAFAFDYHLLLETPPTEWLKMKDTVFSSRKSSLPLTDKVTHEPETFESHKKIKTDILTKYDPYFRARDGKVLDLRTKEEKKGNPLQL